MITLPLWGLGLFWVGLLISLPVLWLYLNGSFRAAKTYHLTSLPASADHFLPTLASLADSLLTTGQATEFWADIETIQTARLDLMRQAQTLIQFETFKWDPGHRAEAFAAVVCQKARAGVTVQILADSYGSHTLPARYWQQLRAAGVEVRFFNPFTIRAPLDVLRRNHRKLLVVDQQVALIGGAGISDLWDGMDDYDTATPWYDFEVQWQGTVVGLLAGFFWQHWVSWGGQVNLTQHEPTRSQTPAPGPVLITPGEEPSTGDSPIRSLLQLCILAAQQRLWLASPYLLPDHNTIAMLDAVQQRGVDVRILTMGPKSDKSYVYYTSRQRYGALLAKGIKIHEYQPSMMHGKIVLIDDQWVSVGSANLDPRSFFHNDELNLCSGNPKLIHQVEQFFQTGFSHSHLVQAKDWRQRPLKERLIGRIGDFLY